VNVEAAKHAGKLVFCLQDFEVFYKQFLHQFLKSDKFDCYPFALVSRCFDFMECACGFSFCSFVFDTKEPKGQGCRHRSAGAAGQRTTSREVKLVQQRLQVKLVIHSVFATVFSGIISSKIRG
jgi:hypothetical protein